MGRGATVLASSWLTISYVTPETGRLTSRTPATEAAVREPLGDARVPTLGQRRSCAAADLEWHWVCGPVRGWGSVGYPRLRGQALVTSLGEWMLSAMLRCAGRYRPGHVAAR